jgi:hypothetical protein
VTPPPIPPATMRALEICADTPQQLKRLLDVYALGYWQGESDAFVARLRELKKEANK